jgi:anthranilate/para-aminobenzoate synthase component I
MGFVSCSGDLCFNILIRTLVWRAERERGELAGRVRYHVGGGITWGSDPAAEDRETLAKGARLAEALSERSMEVPR